MLRHLLTSGSVLALLLTGAGPATATPFETLSSVASTYNVFLSGNLGIMTQAYGADALGEVAVTGNAYVSSASFNSGNFGPNALVVGGNLSSTGGSDNGNVFVGGNATIAPSVNGNLVVGGSLTAKGGSIQSSAFVGGSSANFSGGATVHGSVNLTAPGSSLIFGNASTPTGFYVTPTSSVSVPSYMSGAVHTSGGPATPAPPLDLYGTSTDLANASTELGALPATHVSSSGGTITLTLTQNGLNVIDLSVANGATITGITVNVASGVDPTGLVVNVSGDHLDFNGGTFSLGPLSKNSVLFNFDNATALTLSSLAFEGSLLAPSATVDFVSGDIEGALMADNYYGGGEFHDAALGLTLPTQTGGSSASSPEPRSLSVFAAGVLTIGLILRRRKGSISACT